MTPLWSITGPGGGQLSAGMRTVSGNRRLAIVFPGSRRPPILWYAASLLAELGADVLEVVHGGGDMTSVNNDGDLERLRADAIAVADAAVAADRYRGFTLVGAEVGTHAAVYLRREHAAMRSADAILIGPHLRYAAVRGDLEPAGDGRTLVIVGVGEPGNRSPEAAGPAGEVVAIDADNQLDVWGSTRRSIDAVATAIAAMRRFVTAMSPAIVARVEADFAAGERDAVIAELESISLDHVMARSVYNLDNARRSVLELAAGDLGKVRELVAAAQIDFRDVILWASQR